MSTNLAATPARPPPPPGHGRLSKSARPAARAAPLLATLALLLAACLAEDESPARQDDPPRDTTGPNATTQAPPPDPQLAREYERNGQYEEAVAVLQAIIDQEQEPARQDARLSLARIYLRLQRDEQARSQLELYVAGAPSDADATAGRFLLARTLTRLGEAEQALELYDDYIDDGGFAAPYARLARADLLSSLGRPQEAAMEAEEALAGSVPLSFRLSVLLAAAQAYEQAGDVVEATRWYELLAEESPFPADDALALWRIGSLKRTADDPTWSDDLALVIDLYPETSAAEGALADLLEAGEAVDAYSQGLVHYRNFANEEALQAFSDYLAQEPSGPRAAAAAFYLAATEERLFEPSAALSHYGDSLRLDPAGELADDAIWWRGRILEQMSRLDEARTAYQSLTLRFPSSTWAPEAAFRAALTLYKQERPAEAAQAWAQPAVPSADLRTRFWLAKAHLATVDGDLARDELEALAADAPDDYYGVRAAALLSGDGILGAESSDTDLDLPEEDAAIDWSTADAWIAPFAPPAFSPTRIFLLLPDERWLRGRELLALGLATDATAEFRALLDAHDDEPFALYRLARAFHSLSLTHLAAEAADRLLDRVPEETAAAAPSQILRLAYPADYVDLINDTARSEQISPLLLLALIRQESFFNPGAGSPAGALGLTQVIPSTGEDIAGRLGHADFEADDLYRPFVSISFGASYLSRQLTAFDGELLQALAAYNAGPGNAAAWAEAAGDDVDLFLETIEFEETRDYVVRVVENLARYRELYAEP